VTVDGKPVAAAWLHVQIDQGGGARENYDEKTDADGNYRIGSVSEGTAVVKATAVLKDDRQRMRSADAIIKAGSVTRLDFDISTEDGNTIAGRVLGLNEGEGKIVMALPPGTAVPARLSQPLIKDLNESSLATSAARSVESEYRLEGLEAGAYTVVAIAITPSPRNQAAQVASILDWRVASATVTVRDGEEAVQDFDLTGEGASQPCVAGTVIGVEEGEGLTIAALKGEVELPTFGSMDDIRQFVSRPDAMDIPDEGVAFELLHLRPGTYTLFAFAGAGGNGLPRVSGRAVVEVVEGQTTRIDLQAAPFPSAEGAQP